MFGINGTEFIIVLIVGVIVLGPSRAAQAMVWLQQGIVKMRGWSAQMREYTAELRTMDTSGVKDLNSTLGDLNPSQLDPRTMIREAVAEEMQLWLNESKANQLNNKKQS
ncbi:hypothetical protein EBF03_06180 [Arcanobacterium haemolyticum]|uniref:Uncharacterized protein n=1 Tax=Arcanobacterium haemolyticum (strain ATCC 9345 / DSM 20595 / CCM 5947 / CCUG 17215 / LMG 16163 / NBRC 15585 / NCTC 8452 / 11018) TaxID=644284 RepID=D7BJY3_ARCHD|nr:hypothetical protein [Arcanobacterium haemolyticum]ADH92963.1 conserved hypothetical protein [Arcanobacterium haemolyticum DSM 20595]QCX47035.1 hypothetical protein EBF03_06180 [Arcanobacterium haemolyticum]SQH28281.1 sec-independent translocase [Arcanobacterium haemolyticum]